MELWQHLQVYKFDLMFKSLVAEDSCHAAFGMNGSIRHANSGAAYVVFHLTEGRRYDLAPLLVV